MGTYKRGSAELYLSIKLLEYSMKKLITTFMMFCSILSLSAQQYGNEWIDYSKTHYKFKVGADGIYKINYTTLKNAGFPVDNFTPQHIAIYLNGSEVPVYVEGENDGSFDPSDFIEFFGRANDGQLDSSLYRSPSEHTNPYHSLYNDSSVYYIVDLNSESSKHIKEYSNTNFLGKKPDVYFEHTSVLKFDDDHFGGIPNGTSQQQSFSEYTNGEGFLSPRDNRFKRFFIETPSAYPELHTASIDVSAFSRNNPSEFVNGYNHSFGIAIGSQNNIKKQSLHNGYFHIRFDNIKFQSSELDSVTTLFMGETDIANRPLSYHTIAFVRLKYQRSFNLGNRSTISFSSLVGNDYYQFTQYGKQQPIVYDLTNLNRIKPIQTGTSIEFNTATKSVKQLFLWDLSDVVEITKLDSVTFNSKNYSDIEYLIISSQQLNNGPRQYADYRSSSSGGNYKVGLFYSENLYDEFFYGYHHPLAIRNFIRNVERTSVNLKYILLLGKGQEYHNVRYNRTNRSALDLVPAIGLPVSDYLYVSDLSSKSVTISTPIGRIPARSESEVMNYLRKIMEHESLSNAPWMKHIIQIAGGGSVGENSQFKGHLDNYFDIAKDSALGARRTVFSKQEAAAVDESIVQEIQDAINDGANIVNYFGHGSAQVIEVDFGEAKDLSNKSKYPLFLFNGCALGNTFVQTSKAENYLLAEDKGCLGWIAGTGFGFISPLVNYTQLLYEQLLQKNYGNSIGSTVKNTIEEYGNPNNALNVLNARQLLFQGDPALRIHSPGSPDMVIHEATVNSGFSTISDIELSVILTNIGRTSSDSFDIRLLASDGNQSIEVITMRHSIPNYTDSLTLQFEKSDFFVGLINFTLLLDPTNEIDEVAPNGELNNEFKFEHLFELKKPLIIYPQHNSIVNSPEARVTLQIPNSDRELIDIVIEVDTLAEFNSNIKTTKRITTDSNIVVRKISLPPINNKDFYLRVKSNENSSESQWSNVSFAYLFGDSSGWSEGDKFNMQNITKTYVEYDSSSGLFEFTRKAGHNYSILTNGRFPTSGFNWNFIRVHEINIIYNYVPNGVHIMAFHPNTQKRWNRASKYNQKYPANPYWGANPPEDQKEYYIAGEYTGVYLFPTAQKDARDSMLTLLKELPEGYHIAMHNNRVTGIEQWEQEIFDELAKYGITGLDIVSEGEPFALFGTKGDPSQSKVQLGDYSDTINPPINQNYQMTFDIFPKSKSGNVKTETIGPAKSWSDVRFSINRFDSNRDSVMFYVFGIKNGSNEELLISTTDSVIDISNIDASTYPYLRLGVFFEDDINYTPLNIARWTVHYTGVSEIAVDLDTEDKIAYDTVDRGRDMYFSTALRNLSEINFDSSILEVKLVNESGQIKIIDTLSIDSISLGDIAIVSDTFSTIDLSGDYQLLVTANVDRAITENEYKNNLYFKRFHVRTDSENPLLDVTFDGTRILNNDIVSASPEIVITATDNNPYLLLDNPELFSVELKYPGSSQFVPITIDSSFVRFESQTSAQSSARFIIGASNLPDGTYTLTASVQDRTGNGKEITPYVINFVVENEQTVTNVYPYPNPFTTCAKFVFTCTGTDAPEQIQIRVYNISGKLVKTISKEDLGPIRIGNNVTDYCWDGTDEYGDRLANGVYLYKVDMFSDGERIKTRETAADHLFTNGFGKIYIAR